MLFVHMGIAQGLGLANIVIYTIVYIKNNA